MHAGVSEIAQDDEKGSISETIPEGILERMHEGIFGRIPERISEEKTHEIFPKQFFEEFWSNPFLRGCSLENLARLVYF